MANDASSISERVFAREIFEPTHDRVENRHP
jgi:hypothetical protein